MEEALIRIMSNAGAASGLGVWALVALALGTIVKAWPAINTSLAESGGSLRKDLMARIEGLEDDLRAERRSCDEHLREMRNEIAGLQRQLIAFQLASGRPLPLTTPEPSPELDRIISQLDGQS